MFRKINEDDKNKCIELYNSGKNFNQIGEILGIYPSSVSRIIEKSGEKKERGRIRTPIRDDKFIYECIEELRAGASYEDLWRKYNVSSGTVIRRAKKLGIELNLIENRKLERFASTDKYLEEIKNLYYNTDLTLIQIGKKFGMSKSQIDKFLQRHGLDRDRLTWLEIKDENEIINEYLNGFSYQELAQKYGFKYYSIRRWLSFLNLDEYLYSSPEESREIENLIAKGYTKKQISEELKVIIRRVEKTIDRLEYKECFSCKKILEHQQFVLNDSSDLENHSYCRNCKNINSRKRRKSDPYYKAITGARDRARKVLRNNKKDKTIELLGCSVEEFKNHLESQFRPNMTWENHGAKWHIDHIIPIESFDLSSPDAQKIAFNWSNCQPLWATTKIAIEMGENESYIGNLDKSCRRIWGGIHGEKPS